MKRTQKTLAACQSEHSCHAITPSPSAEEPPRAHLPTLLFLLGGFAQAAFLIWLFYLQPTNFVKLVWTPDTVGYVAPAQFFIENGRFPPDMVRTIGYPLFLAFAYTVGGAEHGAQVALILQSIMNLAALVVFWTLLSELVPRASTGTRLVAAAIFWFASFGMALDLMSDFLFGFWLLLALSILWRGRSMALILSGAGAVAAAGFTRPSVGGFVLLLPLLALTIGRVASPVRPIHLGLYLGAVIAVTLTTSYIEHRKADRYSDSFEAFAAQAVLWNNGLTTQDEVKTLVTSRAGLAYHDLTRAERTQYSRAVLIRELTRQPVPFLRVYSVNFAKYLMAPIERIVEIVLSAKAPSNYSRSRTRGILSVLWLPILLLAIWPSAGTLDSRAGLYMFALLLSLYFLLLGSFWAMAGERYRYPALPWMLMHFAGQLEAVKVWIRPRLLSQLRRRPLHVGSGAPR